MTKRILVGLAGTAYTPVAIRTAVELGARHGAELTGVTVVDLDRLSALVAAPGWTWTASDRSVRLREVSERVRASVAELSHAAGLAKLPHRVLREVGEPFEVLLSASRYHDQVVLGVRGLFETDLGAGDPGKMLAHSWAAGCAPFSQWGPNTGRYGAS
ncbi:MAG: universal stress protein [Proteobacteria bacterium]|nr:universal stress protein [Pseudomonadota bacterium]